MEMCEKKDCNRLSSQIVRLGLYYFNLCNPCLNEIIKKGEESPINKERLELLSKIEYYKSMVKTGCCPAKVDYEELFEQTENCLQRLSEFAKSLIEGEENGNF